MISTKSPEAIYSDNVPLSHRKKYAQFFTPPIIADIMVSWLLGNDKLHLVLEPAFGLGIFSRTLLSKSNSDLTIKGFDIDKITDAHMEELADKMSDDYCEQLFWDSMEIIADCMGLPRKEIPRCPKCQSEAVKYDISDGLYHCGR